MGIRQSETQSPIHWRSFLALEQDIEHMSRYVEIASNNFSTYSLELAAILLSAGSEVDVVAKQLCHQLKAGSKAGHIGHYAQQISSAIPAIPQTRIAIRRFGMELRPWVNWAGKSRKKPDWWRAYNEVKHQRHKSFSEANLKNVLNAMAGLLILTLYLYKDLATAAQLTPNPILFRPVGSYNTTMWDTEILINYAL